MITKRITLTHFSLVGFNGESDLWKDFPFLTHERCPVSGTHRPAQIKGDMWHVPFAPNGGVSYIRPSEEPVTPVTNVEVISDFQLGKESVVRLNGKEYIAWTNFGFDQRVLAFSLVGVSGGEISPDIFTNSVKVYTTESTTEEFLNEHELFK
ncbi:MAG: hypothetical protein ACI8V7_000146 [Candidatus Paceibacteria bacterium]|jgi:hypothetical protein